MINVIINVRKEAGWTSHDVVAKLRGIFHQKKIGHTGTLDPDATGVLPVCLGRATKLCSMIEDWDKTYECVMLLGQTTDTEDISGRVLSRKPVEISQEEIRRILLSFVGDYDQIPPMYSAKKVNGKKLYELAREGVVIERKPSKVHIYSIDITDFALPRVTFRVKCSKGTYIRSLCRDAGEKAGCGGCMENLVRTAVDGFRLSDSYSLQEIEDAVKKMRTQGTGQDEKKMQSVDHPEMLLSIASLFSRYPELTPPEKDRKLLMNGNPIPYSGPGEIFRVYDREGHFIGLYKNEPSRQKLEPYRLFFDI